MSSLFSSSIGQVRITSHMLLTLLASPVIKQAIEYPCGEIGRLLDLESMSLCLTMNSVLDT